MTTPDVTANTNSDAPEATVPWGKTEYVSIIASIGSLLNGYLGKDYGLSKNAQALSLVIGALILMSHNLSRAVKHHAAIHANAAVYLAQLKAVTEAVQGGGGKVDPATIAAGVSALNAAVVADTASAAKPQTAS